MYLSGKRCEPDHAADGLHRTVRRCRPSMSKSTAGQDGRAELIQRAGGGKSSVGADPLAECLSVRYAAKIYERGFKVRSLLYDG